MTYSSLVTDYQGYGAAASRPTTPNTGPNVAALYLSTDTSVLNVWNGATWTQVSASAVTGPGSSTDRAIATWNGIGGAALRNNTNATVDSNGLITAPALIASGLTGATAASRYVGATSSGAPGSGTFTVGDFVVDRTGKMWVCTTAGTPGTWTQVGGGGGGASHSYIGYNTIGASYQNWPVQTAYLKQVVLAASGFIHSIGFYVKDTTNSLDQIMPGVWADNSGVPGVLQAGNAFATLSRQTAIYLNSTARWLHIPVGFYVPAGTYWIGGINARNYATSSYMQIAYDTPNVDYSYSSSGDGGAWLADGGQYTTSAASATFSIRADFLPA